MPRWERAVSILFVHPFPIVVEYVVDLGTEREVGAEERGTKEETSEDA